MSDQPFQVNHKDTQPILDPAKGRLFNRDRIIDGTYQAAFGPGQTPLSIAPYAPPTDWMAAGTLLRPPKIVWISLNYGPIGPISTDIDPWENTAVYDTVTVKYGAHEGSSTFTDSYTDPAGHHPSSLVDVLPWTGGDFTILSDVTTFYEGGTTKIRIPGRTQWNVDPRVAPYMKMRGKLLDFIRTIQSSNPGKVWAILADYSLVDPSSGPSDTSIPGRRGQIGCDITDGDGNQLADLFTDVDPLLAIYRIHAELIAPLDGGQGPPYPWFGTDFVHIYIGIPADIGINLTAYGQEASDRVNDSALASGIAENFSTYQCFQFGLAPYALPNYWRGTVPSPPVDHLVGVPASDAGIAGLLPASTTFPPTGDPDFIHEVIQPARWTGTQLVSNLQQTPEEFASNKDFRDALKLDYDTRTGPGAVASYPRDFELGNVILRGECDLLAEHGFTYVGDSSAVDAGLLSNLITAALGPGVKGLG